MSNRPFSDRVDETERQLRRHVEMLSGVIGERNVPYHFGALEAAAQYIEDQMRTSRHSPTSQRFQVLNKTVRNIVSEVRGVKNPERIWVVGAHYDSIDGSPAANDNGSGIAGVLEMARLLGSGRPRDTIRFVAFVNEEPPFYKGSAMGSLVYAQSCREKAEQIMGMVNLEMIGCYSNVRGSQRYPVPLDRGIAKWFLPDRGNFIAFVGNTASWKLTWRCRRLFKKSIRFPSLWIPAPRWVECAGMSDHWSFWEQGYPAVMVTDTAFFRYSHYHKASDTSDKINYPSMARVVSGLAGMMRHLIGAD